VNPRFKTTQWTVLRLAADSRHPEQERAVETICRSYWLPVYSFVRRRGHGEAEAKDLTQEFFLRLVRDHTFGVADPERGRFRTFLIRALRNFLTNEWRHGRREKRGGGVELLPLDMAELEERYQRNLAVEDNPEKLYERKWAQAVVARVSARLEEEFKAAGRERQFAVMKGLLVELNEQPYGELAGQLDLTTAAFKVAVHRFRARFRELFREEIAALVDDPREVESEISHVISVLRG
jgi:RNA polymerase sigma-70 factor (ECF subfamily)